MTVRSFQADNVKYLHALNRVVLIAVSSFRGLKKGTPPPQSGLSRTTFDENASYSDSEDSSVFLQAYPSGSSKVATFSDFLVANDNTEYVFCLIIH